MCRNSTDAMLAAVTMWEASDASWATAEHAAAVRLLRSRSRVERDGRRRDVEVPEIVAAKRARGRMRCRHADNGIERAVRSVSMDGSAAPQRHPHAVLRVNRQPVGYARVSGNDDERLSICDRADRPIEVEHVDLLRRAIDEEHAPAVSRPV